jgi:RHS repeat-associated protein
VGNLTGYKDTFMGSWVMTPSGGPSGYDSLNRQATASATWPDGTTQSFCWQYDSFGNRLEQESSPSSFQSGSGGASACNAQSNASVATDIASYNSNNQIQSTNARGVTAAPVYDASGNVTYDGANQYLYDADGRICAVLSIPMPGMTAMTGYLYDADGTRVAKGTITTMSCDPTTNGFQFSENYVLGPGGEELTMLDGGNNWQRTNVYAAGKLLATYDVAGLHFHLEDPLGTRRMQLSGELATLGQPETDIQSLPFGDQLNSYPDQYTPSTADDASPLHFTGKERDAESGNDYFEARYYSSAMGRFMSPDWSAEVTPVPYATIGDPQSLNLYAYARNNPITTVDPDGHEGCDGWSCANLVRSDAVNELDALAQQNAVNDAKEKAQQNENRQPDGSYKATSAQLAEIQDAANKKATIKSPTDSDGECVTACKKFTGVPGPTSSWRGGKPASELTDKDKGTAIATFQKGADGQWHYLPDSGGHKNSGTFMGTSTNGTFWMADQWPGQRPVRVWNVGNDSDNASMNAASYRVIIVPNP